MTNWGKTFATGIAAGAALAIEHQAFYDPEFAREEPELAMLTSNVMGVATLIAAAALDCALGGRDMDAAARFGIIAAIGGSWVLLIRQIRRDQRLRDAAMRAAGHAVGSVHGGGLVIAETYRERAHAA